MDNQHRHIRGYRELDEFEISVMNEIKDLAAKVGNMVQDLRIRPDFDQRWVSIGETHLQQGFMALTRAVAKPEGF